MREYIRFPAASLRVSYIAGPLPWGRWEPCVYWRYR